MLENSYDASGVKFGLVCSPDFPNFSLKDLVKSMAQAFKGENAYIIDFEAIDGLTVNEILGGSRLQSKDAIIICAYSHIEYEDVCGKRNAYNAIYNYYIVLEMIYKDMPIDQAIESIMLNQYSTADDNRRKYARCFLERYRYGTKEKVDEQIQKIMRK